MASKAKVQKFETTNKANIKGRVGHTRTGACTSHGKCNHGKKQKHHSSSK